MNKILTLVLVQKDSKILLGEKKRGFGAGRLNGFGGKVEAGEEIVDAAHRELFEEAGIRTSSLEKMGVLLFSFDTEEKVLEVHIFRAFEYEGEPFESEEMRPEWFALDSIPYEKMWSDDEHWLPYLLEGKKFKGSFHFDRPSDAEYSAKILKKELFEVPNDHFDSNSFPQL